MTHKTLDDFTIDINPRQSIFVISVVSEMVHLPIWTLRKLDTMGVVKPRRIGKKARCYSMEQVKTLQFICYLMQEKGVTISNVKIFLEMQTRKSRS